ncbi:MAG: ATP-binding protein [Pseudomonadota bacterium]
MALIAILVFGLMVAGALGLNRVQTAQEALTGNAIPGLAQAEVLDGLLRDLDNTFDDILAATGAEGHRTAAKEASALLAQLRTATAEDADYSRLIADLDNATQAAAGHSHDILAAEQMQRALNDQIAHISSDLLERTEALMLETSNEVELLAFKGGAGISGPTLSRGLAQVSALTRLNHLTERNLDLAYAVPSAGTRLELGEAEGRLAFNIRAAIRLLTRLDEGVERTTLAAKIRSLRALLFDPDGLINTRKRLLDVIEARDNASEAHRVAGESISLRTATEIAGARENILMTARAVEGAIDTTILQSRIMGVIALSLIVAVAIILVERRIIRRLRQLSSSVRKIAGGDNEAPIAVRGADELGEMSRALEVFKGNSRELRRSNGELERFAYAASHDLRSPLRAIHDLAQWTIEDAGDALPEPCRDNLEMLLRRARRLSGLLDDLLSYARAGRETASISEVSLPEAATEILELLGREQDFALEVTGDALTLRTFEAPLRQILMNLIGNAVKHHDRESGTISLDCRARGDGIRIAVSDDGPGIDPKYHERIFGLFETLQSRDAVEGSGMGLAVIRKLVEHYGGDIRVMSSPATRRGTTFLFEWPVSAQDHDQLAA